MNSRHWMIFKWSNDKTSIRLLFRKNCLSLLFSHVWLFAPHESQHARPPCPSPTPRVHSDSHPLSQWCHPAISSSVVPFSSCPQSLPASEAFLMSQLFAWGGLNTGAPSEWTGWISLQSKGLSRVFSNTTVKKHWFFSAQPSLWSNSPSLSWVMPLSMTELVWATGAESGSAIGWCVLIDHVT